MVLPPAVFIALAEKVTTESLTSPASGIDSVLGEKPVFTERRVEVDCCPEDLFSWIARINQKKSNRAPSGTPKAVGFSRKFSARKKQMKPFGTWITKPKATPPQSLIHVFVKRVGSLLIFHNRSQIYITKSDTCVIAL